MLRVVSAVVLGFVSWTCAAGNGEQPGNGSKIVSEYDESQSLTEHRLGISIGDDPLVWGTFIVSIFDSGETTAVVYVQLEGDYSLCTDMFEWSSGESEGSIELDIGNNKQIGSGVLTSELASAFTQADFRYSTTACGGPWEGENTVPSESKPHISEILAYAFPPE